MVFFYVILMESWLFLSFAGDKVEGTKGVLRGLLTRRVLVSTAQIQAPALPLAPAPAPSPHNGTAKRQVVTTFVQEHYNLQKNLTQPSSPIGLFHQM